MLMEAAKGREKRTHCTPGAQKFSFCDHLKMGHVVIQHVHKEIISFKNKGKTKSNAC